MDPLDFWRANDAPDRQGITEIEHVTGYLAYWDELRRRHPTCSSTPAPAAAAVTTWRRSAGPSRSCGATTSSSRWATRGTPTAWPLDTVLWHGLGGPRSLHAAERDVPPFHRLLRHAAAGGRLRPWPARRSWASGGSSPPAIFGDYYPLTPYSLDNTAWIAWQFDCPEKGEGLVQAFRRGARAFTSRSAASSTGSTRMPCTRSATSIVTAPWK